MVRCHDVTQLMAEYNDRQWALIYNYHSFNNNHQQQSMLIQQNLQIG